MKHLIFSALVALGALSGQAIIQPGTNLIGEGIPPITQELANSVDSYSQFRMSSLTSWHPTKRECLMGTRFGDTTQVHLLKMPGGARKQLTFFRDAVSGGWFEPTKGDFFIYSKDAGGDEFFQLYRYDLNSLEITLLTDGKSRNTGCSWQKSGREIAYGSTRRNGNDVDIYVMDPRDPKTNHLAAQLEGGGWSASGWSDDGEKIILDETISVNESYLWILNPKTGEKKLLTPGKSLDKAAYEGGLFSPDGKTVYTATDRNSEFVRLTAIDVETGKHTPLTSQINWDVDGYTLSDDGKRIAYTTNEDGASALHILELATSTDKKVDELPIGTIGGLEWHHNNQELGFNVNTTKAPTNIYSLDINSGKIERWTDSETGTMKTWDFAEPELVKWKSFDGKTISGFLYKPPAKFKGKRPVVINIHGGPEGQFRPFFLGRINYYVNELGVAYIFPNIRGSSGYGKSFLKLDNGYLRPNSYKDIKALLDWVASQPNLDADRVMVTGGSYGGHMTLAIATFYPEQIRCAEDIVGPSNLVTFLTNTQGYRRDLRRVEYGDERDPKMRAFLEKIAPTNNIQKIKKPLFVVQGKNDPRVPASESLQMVSALKKNGTPVWFLMAEDEGHGFAKKNNQDYLSYATAAFIKQFLLD